LYIYSLLHDDLVSDAFDTEIRDSFHEHQCDPFYTGIDHKSGNDLDPLDALPVSDMNMVEYVPVEYEAGKQLKCISFLLCYSI
jgi:hypothetical protein